jgi:hypothetical protein
MFCNCATANKRQSTFLWDHKLHDNLPLALAMARADNGYSLVRYSTIEGWDALPIPLYCPLIVSEQGDVAQTSLLGSELIPAVPRLALLHQ